MIPASSNPRREPIFDALGVRLTGWEPGRAEFTLDIEARHLNFAGRLHGGIIAMLLDVAGGYAAMPSIAADETSLVATISLAINYLAGAPGGSIRSTGRRTGGGKQIIFATCELYAQDGALLATAQGSFRVSRSG